MLKQDLSRNQSSVQIPVMVEMLRELGHGASGRVWVGRMDDKSKCAVKLVSLTVYATTRLELTSDPLKVLQGWWKVLPQRASRIQNMLSD